MNKYHYSEKNKCIDCKKIICNDAKRCKSCNIKMLHKKGLMKVSGKNHWKWKGRMMKNGYWTIPLPEHPHANSKGYVPEHRLVMEKHLSRYLTSDEIIHHINGIRTDNRLENLYLTSLSKHPIDRFKYKNILQKRILELENQIIQLKKKSKT